MPDGLSYEEWLATRYIPIAGGEFQAGESAPSDSGAGGGGGDAGGDGGDSGGEGDSEGSQPDVRSAIDNLSERMDTFMQSIQTQQEDPLDFLDDDFEDDFGDDTSDQGGAEQSDGGQADDLVRSADQIVEDLVERKVQERLAPHLQQQYEERRHDQVVALENKYPDLKEEANATPLLRVATELARSLGEPELAREAPFLETVHLRMLAEAARAEETSGDGGQEEAPIEGGGASKSGGGGGDTGKQVADAIAAVSQNRGIFG